MTTPDRPRPPSGTQASQHLTAVAGRLARPRVSVCLTRIGGIPVLTIEEPAGGPSPATISIDPDLSDPALPLECTCIWTPPPGATPDAIASTITAVLDAVRPPSPRQPPHLTPQSRYPQHIRNPAPPRPAR